MDCKAKLINAIQTLGRTWIITIEAAQAPDIQKDEDVRLIIKKWYQKRSLTANAYMWALVEKIAVETGSTKDEVYEQLIQEHSFIYDDGKGYLLMTLPESADIRRYPGHWRYLSREADKITWIRLAGSSQYDTKEMSYFIDRVIEEAQELGIDTMTPDEVERLKGYERY